jgi:hypothetical protein
MWDEFRMTPHGPASFVTDPYRWRNSFTHKLMAKITEGIGNKSQNNLCKVTISFYSRTLFLSLVFACELMHLPIANLTRLAAVANFLTGALAKCAQSRSILDYCNCDGQNDFLARFHALASFPVVPWHRSLSRRAIVSFGRERQRPWIFARKDVGTKYGHNGCSASKSKCFFCSLFGPVLWRQIFQRAS